MLSANRALPLLFPNIDPLFNILAIFHHLGPPVNPFLFWKPFGKMFNISQLSVMLSIGVYTCFFLGMRKFPSMSSLLKVFSMIEY